MVDAEKLALFQSAGLSAEFISTALMTRPSIALAIAGIQRLARAGDQCRPTGDNRRGEAVPFQAGAIQIICRVTGPPKAFPPCRRVIGQGLDFPQVQPDRQALARQSSMFRIPGGIAGLEEIGLAPAG